MEAELKGRLLLLGEGDFSFSVALLSRCDFLGDQVVATSLETEETIQKHQLAAENRQILQEKGVKICFEVDATDLLSCSDLGVTEDSKFSRIIFNFPHSGGKSNHKRNRALLNNFFASAVKVLAPQGQIMMTLCKGQGGTPADQPMRAWHDSWQVVSMAANSSLILTQVQPFNTENYPEYNSVGFRSLDKGFNTEGALTHIFEVAESVTVPDIPTSDSVSLAGRLYTCPTFLHNKLTRKLLYSPQHPLHQLRSSLEGHLSTGLSTQPHHLDNSSLVKLGIPPRLVPFDRGSGDRSQGTAIDSPVQPSCDGDNERTVDKVREQPRKGSTDQDTAFKIFFPKSYVVKLSADSEEVSMKEDRNREEKEQDETELMNGKYSEESDDNEIQSYLRTSVVEELPPLLSMMATSGVGCHLVSCDSYGQCLIGQKEFPVRHEMMVASRSRNVDETLWAVSRALQNATNFYFEAEKMEESRVVMTDFGDLHITHSFRMVADEDDSGELCGIAVTWVTEDTSLLVVILELDRIVLRANHLPCQSLLWTTDPRFRQQFENQWLGVRYKPVSLYPMKYFHDLSFWENQDDDFNEQAFHNIIRDISGDTVVSIKLIDRYHDDESGRSSRCYRVAFQSHDQALSYITSWKLQSMLRLDVAKEMKITLR